MALKGLIVAGGVSKTGIIKPDLSSKWEISRLLVKYIQKF